jgi:hypothetical protein
MYAVSEYHSPGTVIDDTALRFWRMFRPVSAQARHYIRTIAPPAPQLL